MEAPICCTSPCQALVRFFALLRIKPVWPLVCFFIRRFFDFPDARDAGGSRVDRPSAGCQHPSFSDFRIRGFSITTHIAACLFFKGLFIRAFIRWIGKSFRFLRVVDPVFPHVWGYPDGSHSVLVLASRCTEPA